MVFSVISSVFSFVVLKILTLIYYENVKNNKKDENIKSFINSHFKKQAVSW